MQTAFDGADTGFRLERKGLLSGNSDTLAARELKHLWNRSHHLCRNNPAAITAKNRLIAHWISTGLKVRFDHPAMQTEWDNFIKNPSVDGYGNFYNMQLLWASAYFESGEVFTRFITQKRPDCKIPLKLQVLEAEMLDPLYNVPPATKFGIDMDGYGKPLQYNFWNRHPSSVFFDNSLLQRVKVDARDVLHIFMRDRPGQWRGIPKLTGAMLTIYELDELTDATLVRQKVAQAVGWIITKKQGGLMPLMGGLEDDPTADVQDPRKKLQKILPGGVHYLESDEEFNFAQIQDIGSNLTAMLEYNWRMIASCLDVTYEQLTGDLSGVNFSSIRAGLIEFRRRVLMTQTMIFITLGLLPLVRHFQTLAGSFISANAANATFRIVLPRTEWVDPLKDTQADLAEVRAGFATLQEKLEERGVEDIEAHIQQLAKEQGYEIVLDSNPIHNTIDKTQVTDQPAQDTGVQQNAGN